MNKTSKVNKLKLISSYCWLPIKCADGVIPVTLLFSRQFDLKYFIAHLSLSLFLLPFHIHPQFILLCVRFHPLYISLFLSSNLSRSITFSSVMAVNRRGPRNSKDGAAINQDLDAATRSGTRKRKSRPSDTVSPPKAKKCTPYSSPSPKATTRRPARSVELPTASDDDQDDFAPGSIPATPSRLKLNKADGMIPATPTSSIWWGGWNISASEMGCNFPVRSQYLSIRFSKWITVVGRVKIHQLLRRDAALLWDYRILQHVFHCVVYCVAHRIVHHVVDRLTRLTKNIAHPALIWHVSRRKSVVIMWERNQFHNVDTYERPSAPRLPTWICRNNVGRKSIW